MSLTPEPLPGQQTPIATRDVVGYRPADAFSNGFREGESELTYSSAKRLIVSEVTDTMLSAGLRLR